MKTIHCFTISALCIFAFFSRPALAENVDVITFSLPPFVGESTYSKEGLGIELLREIFKVSSTEVTVKILPRERANLTFENGGVSDLLRNNQQPIK